jgi:hypothetical protein
LKEKILIIHNTDYHTEVVLSFYGILESNNFEPWIYSIHNRYNLHNLFKKYNLNCIKEYSPDYKNNFKKAFLITPIDAYKDMYYSSKCKPIPNYEDQIIEDFKSKMILTIHKPSHINNFDCLKNHFINPILIGLSPMAQTFGLNYLFPLDNILARILSKKTKLNQKIKFLLMGRFNSNFRDINNIINLTKLGINSKRDFEINIVGEYAKGIDDRLKNISFINLKSDLNEIDFYNEINDSDFILNLLTNNPEKGYYYDVISSNYNHIFSFKKPQICNNFSNLISPSPAMIFTNSDYLTFSRIFQRAVNITDFEYEKMIENFEIPISNMTYHNSVTLKNII